MWVSSSAAQLCNYQRRPSVICTRRLCDVARAIVVLGAAEQAVELGTAALGLVRFTG